MPSARRRAADTPWHWLLRLARGKCHCIWQELEIRQTHDSTQFQPGIYLSNLRFAITPNAVGHLGLCLRLAMLQFSGRPWDARVFMFRLQTGLPAGKSRAVQESRQEVPGPCRAHRCDGCGEHWLGLRPCQGTLPCHLVSRQWQLRAECWRNLLCSWSIFLLEIIFPWWEVSFSCPFPRIFNDV